MRYASFFSGIEAATAAWHPLGWVPVAFAEIEPFPCAVLAHHYPDVPNLGDITQITETQIECLGAIDVFVFGSPCQDLSVAGKRAGLQGERSGLFHDAIRIARWMRRHNGLRFALWENVPGSFSSNGGADFGVVLGELAGIEHVAIPPKGWGTEGAIVGDEAMVEWSVLDAQWFGVAQRRRRVFALADFGDWASRPPILLEPDGLRGDLAPRREAGEAAAADAEGSAGGGGHHGSAVEAFGGNRTSGPVDVATAVNAHGGGAGVSTSTAKPSCASTGDVSHCLNGGGNEEDRLRNRDVHCNDVAHCLETTCNDYSRADGFNVIAHTLTGGGFDASEDGSGRGTPLVIAPPIAFNWQDDHAFRAEADVTNPLRASQTEAVAHVAVMPTMANGADTPAGHSARSGNTKDAYVVPVIAPPRCV